ncbi:GDSL-type esterase/lipase family protein [Streptomyces marincola]|uniref:Uncharacterized protein n=1 Tax=Streptomyces marincola TaxID=2878388 RepID=A0A1W7D1T2_9ACTN|nr:GDSL-type esterase/lipase family protein [Streptomyces marincola]ARQ70986.1 hypothetical protein CAG99_21005 [Streptomyces marincola]
MPPRRRPIALSALAALVLTACTAQGTDDDPGGRDREAGGRSAPAGPEWDTGPESVAAIGDSITRAFDACAPLADCPEASWATGTDTGVTSLARQLIGNDPDLAQRTWNLAESGARAADLPEQARRAAAHEPGLLTVLIGGNDACAPDTAAMTPVADFRAHITETVDIVRTQSPDTQVYVASVPDLMRLWSRGSESLLARSVWRMADICPSILADAQDMSAAAQERRASVQARVREYNEVLAEVCAADALCRYDGGAVFDYDFTAGHLSDWDWFHPSREGQSVLATLAYEQVTAEG